jgi:hypothetical protein
MGANTIWGATAKILHEMIDRSGPQRNREFA